MEIWIKAEMDQWKLTDVLPEFLFFCCFITAYRSSIDYFCPSVYSYWLPQNLRCQVLPLKCQARNGIGIDPTNDDPDT